MTDSPDILEKLKDSLANAKPHINVDELLMASQMAFWGVKRKEFPVLKVNDVYNNNGTVKSQISRTKFNLNNELQIALRNYAKYLQGAGMQDFEKSESRLFPSYLNKKKLTDHWKDFGVSFKELHNQGIAFCHEKLHDQGSDAQIEKTVAIQFQLKVKQVKAVLAGKIQPAGRPTVNSFAGTTLVKKIEIEIEIEKSEALKGLKGEEKEERLEELKDLKKLEALEALEGVEKMLGRAISVESAFHISLILLDQFAVIDLTTPEGYEKACQYRDAVVEEASLTKPSNTVNPHLPIIDCMNKMIKARKGRKINTNSGSNNVFYIDSIKDATELLKNIDDNDEPEFITEDSPE